MAVSVVSFSFSRADQPEPWSPLSWVLAFPTTSRPTPPPTELLLLLFNSSALYYLQTPTRWYGHASTPPQLLPISGDRDVSLPLSLEWPVWSSSSGNNCHAVQRSISFGASVYESIMGFFLPRPISSANFRPCDFLSQVLLEYVISFRCITLNSIFGQVKRSKHNTICISHSTHTSWNVMDRTILPLLQLLINSG